VLTTKQHLVHVKHLLPQQSPGNLVCQRSTRTFPLQAPWTLANFSLSLHFSNATPLKVQAVRR
jgi:hypothetical protein